MNIEIKYLLIFFFSFLLIFSLSCSPTGKTTSQNQDKEIYLEPPRYGKTAMNLFAISVDTPYVIGVNINGKELYIKVPKNHTLMASELLTALIVYTGENWSYISYWDEKEQRYKGYPAKEILGEKLRDFEIKPGIPYFLYAPVNANFTFFGPLLKPITYELKIAPNPFGTMTGYNYIQLPIWTSYTKASQLCNDPQLKGKLKRIEYWDVNEQRHKLLVICPPRPGEDKPLKPGKIYRFVMIEETNWTQK